ncbi:MAG: hypothetical protein CSA25_06315 [Desulfobacter postgatei]|uniref:Uncharacterized protein n=1 Tax=Desulfobacter postgatei TaxID=2293 RepID=A0A2G6MQ97_9BACT|nr:MAG: hypothetical protein CSA25_06315 [Desulfobacter postgatei]
MFSIKEPLNLINLTLYYYHTLIENNMVAYYKLVILNVTALEKNFSGLYFIRHSLKMERFS